MNESWPVRTPVKRLFPRRRCEGSGRPHSGPGGSPQSLRFRPAAPEAPHPRSRACGRCSGGSWRPAAVRAPGEHWERWPQRGFGNASESPPFLSPFQTSLRDLAEGARSRGEARPCGSQLRAQAGRAATTLETFISMANHGGNRGCDPKDLTYPLSQLFSRFYFLSDSGNLDGG